MPDSLSALDGRLALIRRDIDRQLTLLAVHLEVAHLYVGIDHDDGVERAVDDAKQVMRAAIALSNKLMTERRTAEINAAAAEEWRAQRDARKS